MKHKRHLATSIFQLLVGLFAVVTIILSAIRGALLTRWVITLILAIAFIGMGIMGIIDHASSDTNASNGGNCDETGKSL